jgi:agmatinase
MVYGAVKKQLDQNKLVGMVGGEHSSVFGGIKAILERSPQTGILQIDAHADLRKSFEGFEYSHASIMYNVMTKLPAQKLIQVGIRDLCQEEYDMSAHDERICTFYDQILADKKLSGTPWSKLCAEIVSTLPKEVYISFDIDGLDPKLCPHTGTPVPGGLSFQEALLLLKTLVTSGKKIVGFDLNEVSPGKDEWDGNVGARILFKLCGWMLKSNGIA